MASSANTCATCKVVFEKGKSKTYCACKRFRFCNNDCYSNRPMRALHKVECEKKAAERIAKEAERKAAAISLKRSEAVQNQPRKSNGQFGNTKNASDKKAAQNRLNSATSKCVKDVRDAGQALYELRKNWQMQFLVVRDDKGCKLDPVVFQTKNFNGKRLHEDVSDDLELDPLNPRQIDLSYEETPEDEELHSNERKPIYRCYICKKLTGPKKGFTCAEQEENMPCQNGAACVSCINLDMKRLSTSERRVFRNNWRCPIHKSGRSDPADDDLEASEEVPKIKKKRRVGRRIKLVTISPELRQLMPEDNRAKIHYTRTEINKGVHQYINDHPELKVLDPETKARLVHPDEALAAVYGSEPFKGFSKIPQLKHHVKDTGLYFEPDQNVDETPDNLGEGTSAENMEGTSGSSIQITSSPSPRPGLSMNTPMSSPDDSLDSGSSILREPKKYLNPLARRALVFNAPPRVPPPPANGKKSENEEPAYQK